jgi:hypothetical protein
MGYVKEQSMLDFTPIRNKKSTMDEMVAQLGREDLAELTNQMVDTMLRLIQDSADADVTFMPEDPDAYDPYAADEAVVHVPWTLGHVIVHATASAEESAALAAELARGVAYHGRSRHEVPWQTITTLAQCQHRLEESRRIRLASLEMWPDQPHLDNVYEGFGGQPINAVTRFVWGLKHDDDHLGQLADIVEQARRARDAAE